MRCLLINSQSKKITHYFFWALLTLSASISDMHAMNEQQSKPNETQRRRCANEFIKSLSSINPTMTPYTFNLNRYNNMNDPVLSNIHAGGSSIHLNSMFIAKLPKDIVKLKGCITDLDLSKNPDLTIDGIPIEIGELGDNFTLKIKGTPLEKYSTKQLLFPKILLTLKCNMKRT